MSARYSSRDVVSSIERLVVGSTLTSFLVFWVFWRTLMEAGMLRRPPRLMGLTEASTLRRPPPLID